MEARHDHSMAALDPAALELDVSSATKWHIFVQLLVWMVMMPAGAMLGLTRSRWHVPVQVAAIGITLSVGFPLGHHHGGRVYLESAHSHFASWCFWAVIVQGGLGTFLKAHVWEGSASRRWSVKAHGWLGMAIPLAAYVQSVFGGLALLGQGYGEHLGQVLAHCIMGSSFVAYGIYLAAMNHYGRDWFRRTNTSPDLIDNTILFLYGLVNTFTEHNFLKAGQSNWSHKDMQHTSLGVVWVAGGALGLWLSRKGQRNLVPAVLLVVTGFAFSGHHQPSELSMTMHTVFGYTLMSAGLARGIEVCLVLRDQLSVDSDSPFSSFQHLPPLLLVMSGVTFMSSHEEAITLIEGIGMDGVTYVLGIYSVAFAIYLWANMLISLYSSYGRDSAPSTSDPAVVSRSGGESVVGAVRNLARSWFAERDAVKPNGVAQYAPVDDGERGSHELDETDAYWEQPKEH